MNVCVYVCIILHHGVANLTGVSLHTKSGHLVVCSTRAQEEFFLRIATALGNMQGS